MPLPTCGIIQEHVRTKFGINLTYIDEFDHACLIILLKLEEIHLVASGEPYLPVQLFRNLQSLYIDMESVRLPDHCLWPSLAFLHLRGSTIDIS